MIVGWVEKRPVITLVATVAALLVKEDAALIISSFVIGAALADRAQGRLAAAATTLCLGWLGLDVGKIQPALVSAGPTYLGFWTDFGDTPGRIVLGLVTHPLRFLSLLATSGWWTVALPGLFLPFLSLRALAGMAPTLVMLGASSNPSMHDYMTYYPVGLVPFALLGIVEARRRGGRWALAALVAVGALPLFWYGYARSVTPRLELERAVKSTIARTAAAPRVVVQRRGAARRAGRRLLDRAQPRQLAVRVRQPREVREPPRRVRHPHHRSSRARGHRDHSRLPIALNV